MGWVSGFLIPLVEVTFIGGIVAYAGWFFTKGLRNAWTKQWKFSLRYKMPFFKRSYPEKTLKWVLDCMDQGIGYYDAKKILMVKMYDEDQINETMYLYDQIIDQLNNQKGGIKNDRKFKGCDSKTQTELPTTSTGN